jgi:catechol 2,3-dioxygenase
MTEVLPPGTAIGAVHLTIADLDRSIRFYQTHLGFTLRHRDQLTAGLGAGGPDLLVLTESPSARRVHGVTGLYHLAILVPSRVDLAQSLRRLVDSSTVMQGFADHGVSEAIYLADPDGNGIEVYHDRSRDKWPFDRDGQLIMGTNPLDVDRLLGDLQGESPRWSGLPPATAIGHVHLHVSHLETSEQFYVNVLGFALMQRYGRAALFVSAGGYHHHVGLNTWAGVGAPAPPRGAIGLRHVVIHVPGKRRLDHVRARLAASGAAVQPHDNGILVRDPSGNALVFTSA